MIGDLKPYPEYKESGLPWLADVPAHWCTLRNGNLFGQRVETGFADLPILEVSLKTGVKVRAFGTGGRKQVMADFDKYKRAVQGDMAYNTMRMWQGALGVCPVDGLVSPAYVVARPYPDVEPRYFAALFKTAGYMAEIDSASRGIVKDRNRLYWEQFKQMRSPCPPPDEQVAIVQFLDWANGRLERAIRAKRKVIALLNEQKQAIIHRAVTRGLDPSVPFKPSGISWLGNIPRHWEQRKLRSLFQFQGSGTTPSGEQFYGGSMNWAMSGDLNDAVVSRTRRSVQATALEAYSSLKLFPAGSLVVAMYGATIGKTAILGEPACTNQACCVLAEPAPNVNVRFVQLAVQTAKPHLVSEAYGGGQPNINAEVVRALRVALPLPAEQLRIVEVVEASTRRIDAAISRLEREIQLVREFSTRLVADVVTGKLDVREAAARLPDDVPSEKTEDDADLTDEPETADEEAIS